MHGSTAHVETVAVWASKAKYLAVIRQPHPSSARKLPTFALFHHNINRGSGRIIRPAYANVSVPWRPRKQQRQRHASFISAGTIQSPRSGADTLTDDARDSSHSERHAARWRPSSRLAFSTLR